MDMFGQVSSGVHQMSLAGGSLRCHVRRGAGAMRFLDVPCPGRGGARARGLRSLIWGLWGGAEFRLQ